MDAYALSILMAYGLSETLSKKALQAVGGHSVDKALAWIDKMYQTTP